MSVWLSFYSNILVLIVGVWLFFKLRSNKHARFFGIFFLATGIASGIAAFGHFPRTSQAMSDGILLTSRACSHLALASFAAGCMVVDSRLNTGLLRVSLLSIFVGMLVWLVADNIFLPVIFFGILCHVLFGFIAFIPYLKIDKSVAYLVIGGIMCNIIAALLFTFTKSFGPVQAADVSHVFIALSLAIMYPGFKRIAL